MAIPQEGTTMKKQKFVLGLSVVAGTTLIASAAFAAWSTGATGGSGQVKANTLTFTVNATVTNNAPASYNQVHPGSVAGQTSGDTTGGDLVINITNPQAYTIHIQKIYQVGAENNTNSSNTPACSNDTTTTPGSYVNSTQTFTAPVIAVGANTPGIFVGPSTSPTFTYDATSQGLTVAANGSAVDLKIANALSMTTASNNACQGAVFTIPLVVVASTS